MLVLFAFKLAATVVSYASGSSGGIFGPSLYIGGMLGGLVGIAATLLLGTGTQPGAFVLVGMGALFAGIVRAPITSIVIIFEMTSNYSIILPLMAANIVSYAVARRLSPEPIYDALLRQDGVRLPHEGGRHLKRLRAGAVMTGADTPLQGKAGAPAAGVHVYPDQTLDTVLAVLGRADVDEVTVVSRKDPRRRLGSITMKDVARAIARADEQELERTVSGRVR
jgi:CIC family chloride channel protein